MKGNNKGFTLMELIVVIAIIAIISVVSTSFTSLIYSQRADEASEVFYSLMSECKIATVSGRKDPKLVLSYDSGTMNYKATFQVDSNDEREERLGAGRVEIYYFIGDAPTKEKVEGDLTITFERATGKAVLETTNPDIEAKNITGLSFEGGNREYELEIVQTTGYFTL